jgi:4-hydroxy-tetrahydrodipicolinate reductase
VRSRDRWPIWNVEPVKVGVFGAAGRMGATACAAIAADPALELVAAVDPNGAGQVIEDVTVAADPEAMSAAGVEAVVDFTILGAARGNLAWCAANGVHAVVGTTGFTDDDLVSLRAAFTRSNCLIAPNFAIGAVLMMRFAELAAPFFETAEIIELHHDTKADAPSGTAMMTAARMAAASQQWAADPTTHQVVSGARGGEGPGGIHVHSVRLRGLVAHQEVLLGTTGQSLTIRHDSYDRFSFMPGVLLAVKAVADHPGVTFGLDAYLDL